MATCTEKLQAWAAAHARVQESATAQELASNAADEAGASLEEAQNAKSEADASLVAATAQLATDAQAADEAYSDYINCLRDL